MSVEICFCQMIRHIIFAESSFCYDILKVVRGGYILSTDESEIVAIIEVVRLSSSGSEDHSSC